MKGERKKKASSLKKYIFSDLKGNCKDVERDILDTQSQEESRTTKYWNKQNPEQEKKCRNRKYQETPEQERNYEKRIILGQKQNMKKRNITKILN